MIKIPNEYKNLNYKHLKIIAMLVDSEINKPIEKNSLLMNISRHNCVS